MKGQIPRRPTGSDAESIYLRAVWDKLWGRESGFNDSSTVSVSKNSAGTSWHIKPVTSAVGGIAVPFTIEAEFDSYVLSTSGISIAKPPGMQTFVGAATLNTFPLTITGGGGIGAIACAVTDGSHVIGIIPISCGSGYTTDPSVSFSAGGGSSATCSFYIGGDGRVTLILGNGGSGYGTYVQDKVVITPPYAYGSQILAAKVQGGTGLMDEEDNPILYEDLNNVSRIVMFQQQTCENLSGTATPMYRAWASTPPYAVSL